MNQNFRYIENYMRSWIVAADNLYVSSSMKHSVLHKRRMRKVKKVLIFQKKTVRDTGGGFRLYPADLIIMEIRREAS